MEFNEVQINLFKNWMSLIIPHNPGAKSLISERVFEMFYDDRMLVDPSIPIESPRPWKLLKLILGEDYVSTNQIRKFNDNDAKHFLAELRLREQFKNSILLYDIILDLCKPKKTPEFSSIYRVAALVFLIIRSLTKLKLEIIIERVSEIVKNNMSNFLKNYGGMANDIYKAVNPDSIMNEEVQYDIHKAVNSDTIVHEEDGYSDTGETESVPGSSSDGRTKSDPGSTAIVSTAGSTAIVRRHSYNEGTRSRGY